MSEAVTTEEGKKGGGFRRARAARLLAVQILYRTELLGGRDITLPDATTPVALLDEAGAAMPADPELTRLLLRETARHHQSLADAIGAALSGGRRFERLDPVLRCILRLAACEIRIRTDIDVPILISEYLTLTEAFYDASDVGLVNAVLDRLAKTRKSKAVSDAVL